MRKLIIFIFFLVTLTVAMHFGDFIAFAILLGIFLFLYDLAEKLDETD